MKKTTVILFSILTMLALASLGFATTIFFKTDNPGFSVDPAFYKNLGNELVKKGDTQNAIAAYEKSLDFAEDDNLRSNLAILYYQQGSYSEAIRHLRVLVTLNPDDPSPHYDLAVNLVDRFRNTDDKSIADLQEALAQYETASKLSPGYSNSENNIAVLKKVLSGQ